MTLLLKNERAKSDMEGGKQAQPWLFFFLILPAGISVGFACVTLPFILSKHSFSIAAIGSLTAIGTSANLWRFVWAPLVDTTFSLKKWHLMSTVVSGLSILGFLFIPLQHSSYALLIGLTFVSQIASTFIMSPSSAYLAKIVSPGLKGRAAGWFQAGNLGGMGLGGGAGIWLYENVNYTASTIVLAAASLLCLFALLKLPDSPAIREQTFRNQLIQTGREVKDLIKSRVAVFTIFLIVTPIGSGAAGNLWSSVSSDWHVSADMVALVTGSLSGVISIAGCIVGGWLADKRNRWWSYLGGSLLMVTVTLCMMQLPFDSLHYSGGVIAYAFATGIVNAGFSALLMFAIGNKGMASTKYALLSSLGNLPVVYMTAIDGWAHDAYGIKGMLLLESLAGLAFIIIFIALLRFFGLMHESEKRIG